MIALHVLAALGALLLPCLLGLQVVRALGGGAVRAALGVAGELGLAFGTGLTLVGAALGLAYAAGLPWAGPVVGTAALLACMVLVRRRRRAEGAEAAPPRAARSLPSTAGVAVLLLLVVGVAILSWRAAASFPDAHQVWMLRGKVLFVDQGFHGDYFREWRTAHDNRSYPPLLSLSYAWMHEVTRSADMRAAKLLSAGFFVAMLAVTYGALRRSMRCGPALALAFALGAGTTFIMLGLWGIADLPLAFHLLCAGALMLALPDGLLPKLLPIPVAAAVLTKGEGMPIALAVAAGYALRIVLAGQGHGMLRRILSGALHAVAILLPALAALALWWWLCSSLGLPLQFMKPVGDGAPEPQRLEQARLVLRDFGSRLPEPGWFVIWLGFGLALVVLLARTVRRSAARNGEPGRCLAAATTVVLTLAAYVVVLSGYPGDLPYLLRLSSGRLMAHVVPLALVLASTALVAEGEARLRRDGPSM